MGGWLSEQNTVRHPGEWWPFVVRLRLLSNSRATELIRNMNDVSY